MEEQTPAIKEEKKSRTIRHPDGRLTEIKSTRAERRNYSKLVRTAKRQASKKREKNAVPPPRITRTRPRQ